jgi:hypothetical protein
MQPSSPALEGFFRIFESNSNSNDVDATVSQFADVFMAASPQGVQAVRAADFALALPKRKQYFDSLGCRSTKLVSLREQRLDPRYVLATTQWSMTFARPDLPPQDVLAESVFIVDTGRDQPKVVFYLANQDLVQILKDRGIATP